MGKEPRPKREEVEFIFRLFLDGYKDGDILTKYTELQEAEKLKFPYRTDVRLIKQLREEFNASRTVLEPYLRQRLDPAFEKARGQHLDEIHSLIDHWWSEVKTPEIYQVAVDFSGFILSENRGLSEGAKEHLPFPSLWQDYGDWKTQRTKYIGTCKKLRRQIRKSWVIKETEIAPSFEEPILRCISGLDTKLRYDLFIIEGHQVAELKYQQLQVNSFVVVEGWETKTRQFYRLTHEECRGETLPATYQRIANSFLGSKIARQAKQSLLRSRDLERKICGSFQQGLLRRVYVNYTCKLCPGQAQKGLV